MKKRIWWTCLQLIKKKKLKSNGDEVTDFYDKEIPKVDSNNTCLAIMSMDSITKNGNYYMQVFLKDENTLKKKWLDIFLVA